MSLVQAYIYKDFIVVGGDGRVIFDTHISESYKKVYKLNDTTIIGMAGSIGGNACLFGDYINEDFSLSNLCHNSSYNDIINHLTKVYTQNRVLLDEKGIISIVCGWDGQKMTGKSFFTKTGNTVLDGISDLTPKNENEVRVINCGLDIHYENALNLGKQVKNINILQMKNIFRNVINSGIEIDKTINDNITFEKIRKVDVI